MKVLFVNSCIRNDSRTLRLCREYINKYFSADDIEIEELVLQNEDIKPFNGEMLEKREADIAAESYVSFDYKYARQFADADIILIGAPYWDCNYPSVLKAYIEHICVRGITFGYVNGVPAPLSKAQELIYITTAGGYFPETCSLDMYLNEFCAMIGIPKLTIHKADGLDIIENDIEAILSETISKF